MQMATPNQVGNKFVALNKFLFKWNTHKCYMPSLIKESIYHGAYLGQMALLTISVSKEMALTEEGNSALTSSVFRRLGGSCCLCVCNSRHKPTIAGVEICPVIKEW